VAREGHKRIVWACSWAPLLGGETVFATGARDKGVSFFLRFTFSLFFFSILFETFRASVALFFAPQYTVSGSLCYACMVLIVLQSPALHLQVKLWAISQGAVQAEATGGESAEGSTEHGTLAVHPIASIGQWPQAVTALAWSPSLTPQERGNATGLPPTFTSSISTANSTVNSTINVQSEASGSGVPGPGGSGVSWAESSILAVGMEGGEIELWKVTVRAPGANTVTGIVTATVTRDAASGGVGGSSEGKGWDHLEVLYKAGGKHGVWGTGEGRGPGAANG